MKQKILDILERTVSTFVTTALGLLIVSGVGNVDGIKAAAVAGLAAALAVLKNVATEFIGQNNGGKWWQDMIERTGWTYLQTWIGLVLVSGTVDFTSWNTAAIAAIPAALTVVKSYLAKFVGDPNTAALSPQAG